MTEQKIESSLTADNDNVTCIMQKAKNMHENMCHKSGNGLAYCPWLSSTYTWFRNVQDQRKNPNFKFHNFPWSVCILNGMRRSLAYASLGSNAKFYKMAFLSFYFIVCERVLWFLPSCCLRYNKDCLISEVRIQHTRETEADIGINERLFRNHAEITSSHAISCWSLAVLWRCIWCSIILILYIFIFIVITISNSTSLFIDGDAACRTAPANNAFNSLQSLPSCCCWYNYDYYREQLWEAQW